MGLVFFQKKSQQYIEFIRDTGQQTRAVSLVSVGGCKVWEEIRTTKNINGNK